MRFPVLFAIVLALIALLMWQFPHGADAFGEKMRIVYLLCFLALVAGGGIFSRMSARTGMKYAGLWLLIIAALVLFYQAMRHIM